jgi:hypothetical protein
MLDSGLGNSYLLNIFLDLLLVELKDLSVLELVLLVVFKNRAVFVHKLSLVSLKLFLDDDVLEHPDHSIKVDILGRRRMIFIRADIPSAMISKSSSSAMLAPLDSS